MNVNRDRLHAIGVLYKGNPDVEWLIATIEHLASEDEVPQWCQSISTPEDGPTLVCRLIEGHSGPHQGVVIPSPRTALRVRESRE